jgi:hypothetical protein
MSYFADSNVEASRESVVPKKLEENFDGAFLQILAFESKN